MSSSRFYQQFSTRSLMFLISVFSIFNGGRSSWTDVILIPCSSRNRFASYFLVSSFSILNMRGPSRTSFSSTPRRMLNSTQPTGSSSDIESCYRAETSALLVSISSKLSPSSLYWPSFTNISFPLSSELSLASSRNLFCIDSLSLFASTLLADLIS